jgi:formate hydrogenlyase subunit 3/multisubunit Na+/H+ antiporter MnhD subunit
VSNSFFIVVSTPFLLFYLQKKHQVNLSVPHLWSFFSRLVLQLCFFIVVSTPFLLFYLQKKHQVNLSVPHLWSFFSRLVLQLSFFLSLFVMLAFATGIVLKNFCVGSLASWHDTLEFLSLVVLYLAMMCGMFFSRNLFGIRCYFFSWQEAHEE